MTVAFVQAHLAVSRELIPLLARSLASQRKLDRTNGLSWTPEQVEALETFEQYASVVQGADDLRNLGKTHDQDMHVDVRPDVARRSDLHRRVDGINSLSVAQYAAQSGKSESYVRRMCRTNMLEAERVNDRWLIAV